MKKYLLSTHIAEFSFNNDQPKDFTLTWTSELSNWDQTANTAAVRPGQGLTIHSNTAHLTFHHGFLLAKQIKISVIYISNFSIHQ